MKITAPAIAALMLSLPIVLPASAEVDRSPPPGGVYRLKPGIYVAKSATCESPANADIREYDGKGISTAHSRTCRVKILSHRGSKFTVVQSCLDAGAGPAKRFSERQVIRWDNAIQFGQTIAGYTRTYNYCPVYQLPKDLRKPGY